MPLDKPIKVIHFPPDTLTFHLNDYDYTTAPNSHTARTDIVVKDAFSTLRAMSAHFQSLDPKEQRNYVIALIVEKL